MQVKIILIVVKQYVVANFKKKKYESDYSCSSARRGFLLKKNLQSYAISSTFILFIVFTFY